MIMRTVLIAAFLATGLCDLQPIPAAVQAKSRACTFETLSREEQSRYQSRYRRRLRTDGKAVADQWLREQACMTPAQRAARRKPLTGKDGRPCRKTRLEMRVTPGFDGAMTMSPVPVCAH